MKSEAYADTSDYKFRAHRPTTAINQSNQNI